MTVHSAIGERTAVGAGRTRPADGERQALSVGAGRALARANVRYWLRVAPHVRHELRQWSAQATAIPDPALRATAVAKLREEHFNAEVASTLATLAPQPYRRDVVTAIVAAEVLYDCLDGLTERTGGYSLASGARLFGGFTSVFDGHPPPARRTGRGPIAGAPSDDGGYLQALSATVAEAVAGLPGRAAVASAGSRAARRCAGAQLHVHATPVGGIEQLAGWARANAPSGTKLAWREYLAGSVASVLSIHALIAAAADSSVTEQQADAIDSAYLSISALSTMLDSLVDYERDLTSGDPWLIRLYGGVDALGDSLVALAQRAVTEARLLPHGAHHLMTLSGVVAYYTSAPEAKGELARPLVARLHHELRPIIVPTLSVMRAWRIAKRTRRGIRLRAPAPAR